MYTRIYVHTIICINETKIINSIVLYYSMNPLQESH